jgi:hypothetical protein
MDRYALAARTTIASFVAMVVILVLLELSSFNAATGSNSFIVVQVLGAILTLLLVLPGCYLWITGFRRFEDRLGYWGPKMLLYLTATIIYAVYLQLQSEHEPNDT